MKHLSRRDFLKGALAAGAAAAMSGIALADEKPEEKEEEKKEDSKEEAEEEKKEESKESDKETHTFADTIKWDAEYDVVVLGMGASGMVAAKTAADEKAHVLIVEKMEEGLAGGNSKVCGQLFAFANHDVDAAKTYYKQLAGGREQPEAYMDVLCEAIANMDDILADEFGFDKEEFVDWTGVKVGDTDLGAMSPEYPEFEGSDKIALWTTHQGVSDGYLFQGFKQNVLDRADMIDVWYETPATGLIQDPETKTVIGAVVSREGKTMNVRALNGVIITTGGFEANPDMVQQYLGVINYAPRGGQYNTGDGIKLAQSVGADLWHMTCYEGLFGLGSVTWPVEIGTPCAQPATLAQNALNTGACILVGTDGNRFVNESETVRHGHLYENGIWENPTFPEKVYVIYDEKQFELVKEGGLIEEPYIDEMKEYASIKELAEGIGAKEDALKATIENFNKFAEDGVDYKCGRESQYMRAFEGDKYYAMYVVQGLLNTQGGPRRNEKAEILDVNGKPIPNLYGAGECGGITACMYQGGTNIAECITFGRVAGKNAAVKKDELPAFEGTAVESEPAKPGEITDLNKEKEYETEDNEYVTSGKGMMGDVTVKTTIEDGKVTKVEILEETETPNIGGEALKELPEKFVGVSSDKEVDAVDAVSGATITTNALKEAIKKALELAK